MNINTILISIVGLALFVGIETEENAHQASNDLSSLSNLDTETTNFEVKALLVKCARGANECGECEEVPKTTTIAPTTKKCDHSVDEDIGNIEELKDCIKKLLLTIKVSNHGGVSPNCKGQYIVIDHVFDPLTEKKQRLLNPYVLKIRQQPITEMYRMKSECTVNSEAKEKVLNKNNDGYTGCNAANKHSTCGSVKYNGEEIPYSTGFCCSCKEEKNTTMNLDDLNLPFATHNLDVLNGEMSALNESDTAGGLGNIDVKGIEGTNSNPDMIENQNAHEDVVNNVNPNLVVPIILNEQSTIDNDNNEIIPIDSNTEVALSKNNAPPIVEAQEDIGNPVLENTQEPEQGQLPIKAEEDDGKLPIKTEEDDSKQILDNDVGNGNPSVEDISSQPVMEQDSSQAIANNVEAGNEDAGEESVPITTTQPIVDEQIPAIDNRESRQQFRPNYNREKGYYNMANKMRDGHYDGYDNFRDADTNNNNNNNIYNVNNPPAMVQQQGNNVHMTRGLKAFYPRDAAPTSDIRESLRNDFKHRRVRHLHKRGGQDCYDTYTPPNADPTSYHDSTHCLEFSDIWYTVYRLKKPKITHMLEILVYEKHEDVNGEFHWKDLTRGKTILIGTEMRQVKSCTGNIIASYSQKSAQDGQRSSGSLPYKTHRLLIPEVGRNVDPNTYPEVEGGPGEYLVVPKNQIAANGKSCNKAGVGYEGFVNQPNRCSMPKSSCLGNQPKQMWQHDHDAEIEGKKGCYFLRNYADLADNPIRGCNDSITLHVKNSRCLTAIVEMQIKADFNVLLRPSSLAIITEVYIDSSYPQKTRITAKIFNSGLVSSVFYVSIKDCPMQLPASFSNIISKPALIPPQHQHIFSLEIHCEVSVKHFFCSLEVMNSNDELIAIRRIRFHKLDRCICVWHCSCSCLLADGRLKCKPLNLEYYHAAGFQGGLPVSLQVVHYSFVDDLVSVLSYVLLSLFIVLLLMGLAKATVGICIVPVSLWGLDVILGLPKSIKEYYEPDLQGQPVVYDLDGWPIHPQTNKKVRNIPRASELVVNFLFFFIYPFATIVMIVRKVCFPSNDFSDKNSSELTICDCKAERITRLSNCSLQVSVHSSKSQTFHSATGKK